MGKLEQCHGNMGDEKNISNRNENDIVLGLRLRQEKTLTASPFIAFRFSINTRAVGFTFRKRPWTFRSMMQLLHMRIMLMRKNSLLEEYKIVYGNYWTIKMEKNKIVL